MAKRETCALINLGFEVQWHWRVRLSDELNLLKSLLDDVIGVVKICVVGVFGPRRRLDPTRVICGTQNTARCQV